MLLWVGLGNPGAKYAGNRHNIGFMAVDRIAGDHGFSSWKPRWNGLASDGRLGDARVTLLKPQQYMNLSGQSVGEAMRYLKLSPEAVTVFHDELDLAPGRLRLKQGGGHAGHNGLRSLHQHIGEGYGRVRLGIGHPGHKDRVSGHVLDDFAKAEQAWLDDLLRGVSKGAPWLAAGDGARFQTVVAGQMQPAEAKPPKPARAAEAGREGNPAPQAAKPAPEARPAARHAPVAGAAPAPGPAPEAPRPANGTPSSPEAPASMGERLSALARRFKP